MKINASDIDDLINKQYKNITKKDLGELEQLSKLFKPEFISGLLEIIKPHLRKSLGYNQELEIALCWIDKRPYADFTSQGILDHNNNVITKKVEVGDAAFFFFNEYVYERKEKNDTFNRQESRSFIFQAKKADIKNNLKVPINGKNVQNDSTAKQLALLGKWPKFDLYKSSNNNSPILKNLNLRRWKTSFPPYGWFGACPDSISTIWKSRWMCGPAKKGEKCRFTLGDLIVSLVNRTDLKGTDTSVGEEFNFNENWTTGKTGKTDSWDELNNEILYLCQNSTLPKLVISSDRKCIIKQKYVLDSIKTSVFKYFCKILKKCCKFIFSQVCRKKSTMSSIMESPSSSMMMYITNSNYNEYDEDFVDLVKEESFPIIIMSVKHTEG